MNTKRQKMKLGDISVDVVRKDIKNVHLSVYPPNGRVRVAAPLHMKLDTVRVFAISKLGWIRKQQERFRAQDRETRRDYISRESHYYMGKRYLLKLVEEDKPAGVEIRHDRIELHVRPGGKKAKREEVLNEFYRRRLKELVPAIIERYERILKVQVSEFGIKRMKTKWGTCNREARRIWLNLDLAKKPPQCLEYIVVHEMVHLLERSHNDRFTSLMDEYMPMWREHRRTLNRAPLAHVDWGY